MTGLESPTLNDAIPLLGLLWLACVLLLIHSMRRYAASRVRAPAKVEPALAQQRSSEIPSPSQAPFGRPAIAKAIAGEPGQPASLDRLKSTLETVRARVARDRPSAQGLIELIRALYLDGSNFTFDTIGGLSMDDRELANALVEAWLADPSAVDAWRGAYDDVRELPDVIPSPS